MISFKEFLQGYRSFLHESVMGDAKHWTDQSKSYNKQVIAKLLDGGEIFYCPTAKKGETTTPKQIPLSIKNFDKGVIEKLGAMSDSDLCSPNSLTMFNGAYLGTDELPKMSRGRQLTLWNKIRRDEFKNQKTANRGDVAEAIFSACIVLYFASEGGVGELNQENVKKHLLGRWSVAGKNATLHIDKGRVSGVITLKTNPAKVFTDKSSAESKAFFASTEFAKDINNCIRMAQNLSEFKKIHQAFIDIKDSTMKVEAIGPLNETGTKTDIKVSLTGDFLGNGEIQTESVSVSLKNNSRQLGQIGITPPAFKGNDEEKFDTAGKRSRLVREHMNVIKGRLIDHFGNTIGLNTGGLEVSNVNARAKNGRLRSLNAIQNDSYEKLVGNLFKILEDNKKVSKSEIRRMFSWGINGKTSAMEDNVLVDVSSFTGVKITDIARALNRGGYSSFKLEKESTGGRTSGKDSLHLCVYGVSGTTEELLCKYRIKREKIGTNRMYLEIDGDFKKKVLDIKQAVEAEKAEQKKIVGRKR